VISKTKARESLLKNPDKNLSLPNKFGQLEIPLKKTAVLDWLQKQPFYPRWYWAERDQQFEMGGAGSVMQFYSPSDSDIRPLFQEMDNILQNSQPGVRFYGGLQFTSGSPNEVSDWKELGSWLFFIPKFEIISSAGVTRLIYNYSLDSPFTENPQLTDLQQMDEIQPLKPAQKKVPFRRHDFPNRKQWQELIKLALKDFRSGKLKKIVLARRSSFKADFPLDPLSIFIKVRRQNPQVFAFFLQPEQGFAFLGVSPEQLYYRQRGIIFSEAVAGTRPRGKNPPEDNQLAQELLTNKKELSEHRWVVKDIERKLSSLCVAKEKISQEEILKFSYVQHLSSRFQGQLKTSITDAEIIRQLHPTPAVAGYPKLPALKRIKEWEPFDRGWYAGPIGWLERGSTEFALALRCAVVKNNSLIVYAGAGIVSGSDPVKEWKEIDNKMLIYTKILSEI
jgi:menaquinone-specific isochorismate synthase